MIGAKSSFPPEAGPGTRLLILGSLPGEISLARGEYYGNPRNQFWRLVGQVIDVEDLADRDYLDRLAALERAGVGLWDVVKTARRVGSLDQHIRDPTLNPLAKLAARLPRLEAVAFNGEKAWKIGAAQLSVVGAPRLVRLPSSSPAHTLAFECKLAAWLGLRAFLAPAGSGP